MNKEFAPIPALLAVSGLHHYLIREGLRTRVCLVLETGEAREVHHFALLIGYGCRRDQSVSRLRNARRHDPRRACCRTSSTRPPARISSKAAVKGVVKVDVQDGHLRRAELSRRADVRSRRPAPGRHRRILHLDRLARRRRRPRRDRAGSAACATARRSRARAAEPRPLPVGRPVPVARGRRVSTCSTRRRSTGCRSRCARQLRTTLTRAIRRARRRPGEESVHAARPARLQARRMRFRSTKSNPSRAS